MDRSLTPRLVALALLVLGPFDARADSGPLAANSTTPSNIRLVGSSAGVVDAATGQFRVVARNVANIPCGGCAVVIDLSNCRDLSICVDQMDPDAVTLCAAKYVRKVTNALGEVRFTLLGGSKGAGSASSLAQSGRIFAAGNLIAAPSVSAFDLDGMGGVGAGDLSVWLADFASGVDWARSDYDGSATVGADDLSMWLAVFGAGGSTSSCGAACP